MEMKIDGKRCVMSLLSSHVHARQQTPNLFNLVLFQQLCGGDVCQCLWTFCKTACEQLDIYVMHICIMYIYRYTYIRDVYISCVYMYIYIHTYIHDIYICLYIYLSVCVKVLPLQKLYHTMPYATYHGGIICMADFLYRFHWMILLWNLMLQHGAREHKSPIHSNSTVASSQDT